jgi:CO/xanthine dehydrogenase Mo-binding subunit
MTGLLEERQFSRKSFVKAGGALVIGLSLAGARLSATAAKGATDANYQPALGPYGPDAGQLDTWLSVNADGTVTLYSGVVELGTGSSTGLLQVAAEELDVPFSAMQFVGPDTLRTPDQFVSSGSRAISQHSPPIRQAAAEARQYLVNLASAKLGVSASQLTVSEGVVSSTTDASKSVSYKDLLGGQLFNAAITGKAPVKDVSQYKIVGHSVPRIDFPGIVSGQFQFVQQLQLHGTLYGRVVRPPTPGASLIKVNGLKKPIPGFVKYVQMKDWLGVIAETEWAAIQAAQDLDVTWSDWSGLPGSGNLHGTMRTLPLYSSAANPQDLRRSARYIYPNPNLFKNTGNADAEIAKAADGKKISVTYTTQFLSHGSIGPSAAAALFTGDQLTVWTSTQTPYGTREALAKFWGLPNNNVRLISRRGSGTYGQNGSDDAAFDASIMAHALDGKPVHVQYMRWNEFQWENYKSARVYDMSGAVDNTGKVVAWKNEDWGFTNYGRPEYHEPAHGGEPGSLIAAKLAGYEGPTVEEGGGPQSSSGYDIPNEWGKHNFLGAPSQREGALRIKSGSMRNPSTFYDTYATESFMDELAALAGIDAIQFRLNHLSDPKLINVLQVAAEAGGWKNRPSPNPDTGMNGTYTGRGVTLGNNVAEIFEVEVNAKTGKVSFPRVTVATNRGLVINPTALTTQVEGGVVMGISEILYEGIRFDRSKILSRDWVTYPIMRFKDAPGEINTVIIPNPTAPPAGGGEPQNEPVAAGVANAIFDATGVRLRNAPFTPAVVRAALKAAGKA